METLKKSQKPMFTRDKLIKLIIPLIIEQLLMVTVGIADTIMVASAGEAAVSGVSNVNTIAILMILVFSALASGGSVVVAQAIGNRNKKMADSSANQLLFLCIISSVLLMGLSLCISDWLLNTIYGNVAEDVMEASSTYFFLMALSFPFLAVYDACASLFRVMGNSNISMLASAIMNVINIIGNAILIYGYGMGVAGAAIATLASRIIVTLLMLVLIRRPGWNVRVSLVTMAREGFTKDITKKILIVAVPMALENSMFQVGKLLTQRIIANFGTPSNAANACGSNLETFCTIAGSAIGLALVTVVGQCVGAGEYKQARSYAKKMILVAYACMVASCGIMILFAPEVVGLFGYGREATVKSIIIIRYYGIMCSLIWPLAFTLPNALRSAGDARFTMIVSMASMWLCRIVMAYVLGPYMEKNVFIEGFGMGILGVWIAMTLDWVVRTIFFVARFSGHKWETKALVKATA